MSDPFKCSGGEHCQMPHDPGAILDEAIQAILTSVDLTVVLERTGRLLREHFGATRVAIHRVLEDAPGMAEVLLVDDPRHETPKPGYRFPLSGSACGQAIASGKPFVVERIDPARPRVLEEKLLGELGYGALASFPLVFEGKVLGTLDIAHLPREGLLGCCLRTAERIARLLAIALNNSLMVEEVRRLNRLLDRENALLKEQIREARKESRYVAESPAMRDIVGRVALVAPTDSSVLIRGETGTGKEGLARMVHEFSPRFGGPFVTVNLGALPDTLIESELFGHEKGAFTGAAQRKLGRFEQANGGTIFLDEVGDAPMSVQVRLLRVLQEREIQRVGGAESIRVDVRVVAATNRPLEKMVAEGTFRSDLYYRLNAFPLHLPPLRDRPEDIAPLAQHFLARHAARMNRKPPQLTAAALRALEEYRWPGNVRELENFLERSLILCPGSELTFAELPGRERLPAPSGVTFVPMPQVNTVRRWDDAVRDLLRGALTATEGRIYGPGGAAELLGLKPTTLQGKLRKYGIKARG